jgi:hypothetical protein
MRARLRGPGNEGKVKLIIALMLLCSFSTVVLLTGNFFLFFVRLWK